MNEIEKLKLEVQDLKRELSLLKSGATIPFDVEQAFRFRLSDLGVNSFPTALADAPLSSVSDPSGGAVVDSQSRTAIIAIIDRLQALGLIN